MASPVIVGITPILIPGNRSRASIMFQNSGVSTLLFKRQLSYLPDLPSLTNYDFAIGSDAVFDPEALVSSKSTAPFYVVSTLAGGVLAIFETIKK